MSHDENEGGFISHLAELRKRLINSFIFLIIFFVACYFFAEHLYTPTVIPMKPMCSLYAFDEIKIYRHDYRRA